MLAGVKQERADTLTAWRRGLVCALGDGDVDLEGFCAALDARGYDGWVVVEQDRVLEDGDVVILQEGKTKKVLGEMNMGSSVYSTPVPANGVLYISNRNELYALAEGIAVKNVGALTLPVGGAVLALAAVPELRRPSAVRPSSMTSLTLTRRLAMLHLTPLTRMWPWLTSWRAAQIVGANLAR